MTEIKSIKLNVQAIKDLIKEIETHHQYSTPPEVFDIINQIKYTAEDIEFLIDKNVHRYKEQGERDRP